LGAGVPAACGVPVAKDLLRASITDADTKSGAAVDEIHKLLRYLYPSFKPRLRNYPNIEDFLNLIEMAKRFNSEEFIESSVWTTKRLTNVRNNVEKLVTDFLWRLMQNRDRFQLITDFAGENIRRGDVIVTFNWDVTIENALHLHPEEYEFEYFYPSESPKVDVYLLKPHGSIDWFRRSQLPRSTRKEDIINLDKKLCVYPYFSFKKNPRLSRRRPVIVPPVATKDFSFAFLRKTWNSVYRAISRASEVQIIGYSLPPEDQFARFVLRRAVRNNLIRAAHSNKRRLSVKIVNPDPTVMMTFSRVIGGAHKGLAGLDFQQALFEDYVGQVDPT
jgi:hypothetical protein